MEMIDAFLEHLRRAGATDATIANRRELLNRVNRQLPYGIGQASTEDLAAWLYKDHWSINTRATYYCGLRAFYSWASHPADPWVTFDPTEDLEPCLSVRGKPRPASNEEVKRILTEAAEPYRTWALLGSRQALRSVEVSRLNREHVTQQNLFVVLGKGNRPRVHDTDEYVWQALKDRPKGPIAISPKTGERATPWEVSVLFAQYMRYQMKMPGVSMHRLRHWCGTTVQRKYRNIRATQAVLGHESLASTQIYTEVTDEEQRAARQTLPKLDE